MRISIARLCLLSALLGLLIACSDGSDNPVGPPRDWRLADLYALQPSNSAANLGIDAVALDDAGAGGLSLLLDPDRLAEPALKRLARQLLAITAGFDAAGQVRRLVYSQVDNAAPDYLLLADTRSDTIAALYNPTNPEPTGHYRGTAFYQHPDLDLRLAMLPGALLAIGSDTRLRELVDRLLDGGDEPESSTGPLHSSPIEFRLALPGYSGERFTLSLRQASELQGGFKLEDGALVGSLTFTHEQAQAYIRRFNELAGGSPAITAGPPGEQKIELPVSLPLQGRADRFGIKQLFQAFDGVNYAEAVGVGANPPWLNFLVDTGPNSIFINFEFADETRRRAFEARELPAGFRLAPLRILEGEEPAYFLVLNIYQASGGLVGGARAEWSVFVEDPQTGTPRFLVVQAAAQSISADPVNLLTFPEPVSHMLEGGEVRSYVGEAVPGGGETLYFRSAFPWPQTQPELRGFAREFVSANDFIFWGNGVADRGVFNGTVYAREAELIAPGTLRIEDRSRWAEYIRAAPRHSLIYRNALEIVVSPWWNLEADYLDVTEDFRQALIDFSNGFYPMTALAAAEEAFRGAQQVALPAVEAADGPSLFLHFRVADPQGLAAELELPDDGALASLPLTEDTTAERFMTLHVYRRADDSCGWRAQWLGYVADRETGAVNALRLESQASEPCLDADALLHEGTRVSLAQAGSGIRLELASLDSAVSAHIDSASAGNRLPSLSWLESLDMICGTVGICDRRFIDGATLKGAMQEIDASGLRIERLNTRWSRFIEREPMTAWVANGPRLLVENPWFNATATANP